VGMTCLDRVVFPSFYPLVFSVAFSATLFFLAAVLFAVVFFAASFFVWACLAVLFFVPVWDAGGFPVFAARRVLFAGLVGAVASSNDLSKSS